MKIAFYAPLKSPNHRVPSGDRTMARALMDALKDGGAEVHLASEFRSLEKTGSRQLQTGMIEQAHQQAADIVQKFQDAQLTAWVTYHNYYKAPDLIGPAVSATLGIPYLIIEATRARKRLDGAWATFAARSEAACDAAQVIFYLTDRDNEALERDAPDAQTLIHLRPFLNRSTLPAPSSQDGPMLSVGMMREGDKLASYLLIADTLAVLRHRDWRLDIIGDGDARHRVEDMMARFGKNVRFLGRQDAKEVAAAYSHAKLLFWPGVNEAFGMTYLEAQAAGVPVVAQDRPGVRDVVLTHGPAPRQGPGPMAQRIQDLLDNNQQATNEGVEARNFIQRRHLRPAATQTLLKGLSAAIEAAA
ncbi:Phosphatidyl-myo-inositol mannosyltransferase [Ascidiaceihabitans donghaensis]|uniref:Phosphatidyl-myo-inositol mannosyltransferase n=2 Tax=Ascidiaceihabitans donghaensis TaxID=1510460 RepID=A0A2R8B9S5_9RHOB|nr:Phosphatidyl-myo-inositol mannosyltransferase [Ascidiaceihabitans donghaensis]